MFRRQPRLIPSIAASRWKEAVSSGALTPHVAAPAVAVAEISDSH